MSSTIVASGDSVHHHGTNWFFLLPVSVLILSVFSPTVLGREWKDSTGKHNVRAVILAATVDTVYLKRNSDEKALSIPLKRLSAADQRYANQHRRAQKHLVQEVQELRSDVAALRSENTRLRKQLQANIAAANQRARAPKVVVVPAPRLPEVIESKIDDDFEGWEGETVVKLANGQIWLQTEYHYEYHYAYRPSVLIYKSGIGYKMKVDGVDEAVGVRRLK